MQGRLFTTAVLIWLLTAGGGRAEDLSFQATVNRKTLTLQDQLTYTLTISGAQDVEPELPEIENFEVLGRSVSTQLSIVNGRAQSSKSLHYTLLPMKAGETVIPPATLRYRGRTYTTRAIPVKVTSSESAAPPEGKESSPRLFVKTSVDREEAYVNEQITLTFKLYSSLNLGDLQYAPPPTVGFLEENLGDEKSYRTALGGLDYKVIELSKAIFPVSSGELTIGAAELRGNILIPIQQPRRGVFDDWFDDDFFFSPFKYERQAFRLRSQPITVPVRPLPADGRPEDFAGSVGSFSLRVEAQPLTVKAGEPVTVTMEVTGEGNIDSVTLPRIDPAGRFKTYDPEVQTQKLVAGDRLAGKRIFKQVFIPLKEGKQDIPVISFSYFDPEADRYATLTRGPIPITVQAAPEKEPLGLVEAPVGYEAKRAVQLLKKDILYIKDSPGRFRRGELPLYRHPFYWGAHLIPLVVLLAVWRIQSRRHRLRSDLVYARQVRASRTARRRFREARQRLGKGDADGFYEEAHRAFIRYLGDKLGLPSGAVTPEKVRQRLAEAGAPADLPEKIVDCFATCDRARFAPGAKERDKMQKFLRATEELVGRVEKLKLK